jgi:hypothetical protein
MPRSKSDNWFQNYPDVLGNVRVNLSSIWSRIDFSAGPDACWTWNGGKHRQGYGMFSARRAHDGHKMMVTVHRILLKEKLGPGCSDDVDAVHTCGNMWCVNPDHLIPGDAKLLIQLQYERNGKYNCGRPLGAISHTPRKQRYKYELDDLRDLARGQMPVDDFAIKYDMKSWIVSYMRKNILSGEKYPWILREMK